MFASTVVATLGESQPGHIHFSVQGGPGTPCARWPFSPWKSRWVLHTDQVTALQLQTEHKYTLFEAQLDCTQHTTHGLVDTTCKHLVETCHFCLNQSTTSNWAQLHTFWFAKSGGCCISKRKQLFCGEIGKENSRWWQNEPGWHTLLIVKRQSESWTANWASGGDGDRARREIRSGKVERGMQSESPVVWDVGGSFCVESPKLNKQKNK